MSKVSTIRGAAAVEGYVVAEIERQFAAAETRGFVLRSEKAIEFAETIEAATSTPVVSLVELLVKKGLGVVSTDLPELDAMIATKSAEVGHVLSDSIAGLVTSIIKLKTVPREPGEKVAERGVGSGGLQHVALPAGAYPAYDCGEWEQGAVYFRGAMATDDGTLWSCQADDTTERPGSSGAWRLMQRAAPEVRTIIEGANGASIDMRETIKREVARYHRDMHRGVWREGLRYEQGQMVTHGGSTWSVQRDGAQGRPGESADFLLIVKKGGDARKGK